MTKQEFKEYLKKEEQVILSQVKDGNPTENAVVQAFTRILEHLEKLV